MDRSCREGRNTFLSHIIGVLSAAALCSGCLGEAAGPDTGTSYVRFAPEISAVSKSSISAEEDRLNDINIYLYRNGILEYEVYTDDPDRGAGAELQVGETYSIYALANVGKVEAPAEESALESFRCSMASPEEMNLSGLPMSAKRTLEMDALYEEVSIEMVRLVSRVSFRLDRGVLGGMKVMSLRLLQTPADVAPFSAASAAENVRTGDFASEDDLAKINSGEAVFFYVPENCQGILLPGNGDQWQKVPENIPDKAALCTYVEMSAGFDGSYGLSGTVLYRFYLGQDAFSDFNIVRNTENSVVLYLTEDALSRLSWRIDSSDVTANDLRFILDAPDYAGQWGSVRFPDADTENPVSVEWKGETVMIPSERAVHLGVVEDDAPTLLVCLPSDPQTLYYCSGSRKDVLEVSCGIHSAEIEICPYNDLVWAVDTDTSGSGVLSGNGISICEDGSDLECCFFLVDERIGEIIDPRIFLMPEPVRKYLSEFRPCPDCNSHLYWYYLVDTGFDDPGYADVRIDMEYKPALSENGETFLYMGYVYALEEYRETDEGTVMTCYQSFFSRENECRVKIYPAFPSQRHVGMIYNMQLAPGSLCERDAEIFLYEKGTGNAEWKILKGKKYSEGDSGKSDGEVLLYQTDPLISVNEYEGTLYLTFLEPPDLASLDRLAGGRYHIRGTVRNPYTGRVINGDYSIDIVLYIAVGTDVRFYRGYEADLPSGTYLDFSYVPVIERYGNPDENSYHDYIAGFSLCGIYNIGQDATYGWGYPFCSGRKVESLRLPDLGDLDAQFGDISSQLRSYLMEAGREFVFVHPVDKTHCETLLYYDPDRDYQGETLFYELHRLQDISSGTYLIEDYFGSFDKY